MLTKNCNPASPECLRRATWLPLLAIAWLQLTLASHQFDHVADYFADTCRVCVHLDRVDNSIIDQLQALSVAPTPAQTPETPLRGILSQTPRAAFNSRAPPQL